MLRFAPGDESREDWQCGVELIGDTQPVGDVELVLIATRGAAQARCELPTEVVAPGYRARRVGEGRLRAPEQLALYDRLLEGNLGSWTRRRAGSRASVRRWGQCCLSKGRVRRTFKTFGATLALAVPEIGRPLEELLAVSEILSGLGRRHTDGPLLVRNFEYYTGPVFHLYASDTQVGGGGRYDALIGLVGGTDVPASGFALDIDALLPLLADLAEERRRYSPSGRRRAGIGCGCGDVRARGRAAGGGRCVSDRGRF